MKAAAEPRLAAKNLQERASSKQSACLSSKPLHQSVQPVCVCSLCVCVLCVCVRQSLKQEVAGSIW